MRDLVVYALIIAIQVAIARYITNRMMMEVMVIIAQLVLLFNSFDL